MKDDLFSFQLAHFTDGYGPDNWFIDEATATSYDPAEGYGAGDGEDVGGEEEIDGPAAATLHPSQEQEDEQRVAEEIGGGDDQAGMLPTAEATAVDLAAASPGASQTSDDPGRKTQKRKASEATETASAADPPRKLKKQRTEEIPYDQRNKRNWDKWVVKQDPTKGTSEKVAKTANRLRRELDEIKTESYDMDY